MTTTLARTDTQRALLDAISANPDDDTPRLAYADSLDEAADGELTPRGEFIRVQCELARIGPLPKCSGSHFLSCPACKQARECAGLTARERDLLARYEAEWRLPRVCERCGGKGRIGPNKPPTSIFYDCRTCHGRGRVGVLNEQQWTRLETGITGFSHVVQPTVTWSRGFPVIECPVAWCCEESGFTKCPQCTNSGSVPSAITPHGLRCSMCRGARSIPDYPHARGTWEEQGMLTVRFTDIEPEVCGATYDWNDPRQYRNLPGRPPEVLWDALLTCSTKKARVKAQKLCYMEFDSPEAAHLALSRACGVWARGLACGRGGVGV